MPTIKRKKKESKEQLKSENLEAKKKTTSKSCWKNMERRNANRFGARRNPLSGSASAHNTNSDSLSESVYIECKVRAKFSIWELYKDTEEKAKIEKKIPLVAIHQKGERGDLYVLRPENVIELAKIMEEMKNFHKE